ncbi:MAG: hypothetical protein PHT07_23860 [Paludibacter sp.]|nr:hypothetical protein [Paludibacter sp.]
MEKVKAKFRCNAVIPNSWNNGVSTTAHLNAVYGTEGENADYSKATPSGNLSLVIDNEVPASKFFEQGKEYYLTFEEAK